MSINQSGLRVAWFGFYLSVVGVALFCYLILRDYQEKDILEWVLTLLFLIYFVPFFYILAKYPHGLPPWARWIVPQYVVSDFREKFLVSNKADFRHAIRGTVLICVVNIFSGVGYGLGGWDCSALMTVLGLVCAWQLSKIWDKFIK